MASRDLWSRRGSLEARALLASLMSSLLLGRSLHEPLYVCSAFLSDFPLYENGFRQFQPLFAAERETGEKPEIFFSDALREVASFGAVRIVGVRTDRAEAFLTRVLRPGIPTLRARWADALYHEKGMLCERFYVEGSMNFTYNGVYRRGEKITVYTGGDIATRTKMATVSLEMGRLWDSRAAFEVQPV